MEFQEGDLVWTRIRTDRFPQGKFSNLKPRVNGPFKILEKIVENAYKIELPKEYDICRTFKVKDLRPYHGEKPNADMWTSLFSQPWGNDVGVSKWKTLNLGFLNQEINLETWCSNLVSFLNGSFQNGVSFQNENGFEKK